MNSVPNNVQIHAINRILYGDCVEKMKQFPASSIDMILTDPPYLVNYKDRDGRTIANDNNGDWLEPAFFQMYRLLKPHSYCIVFYGWNCVDVFMDAWKQAGFRIIGQFVFQKGYSSGKKHIQYQHECAYLLSKGSPSIPQSPLPSILPWKYTGNVLHPTQKPVESLQLLIESFSDKGDIVLDPFMGSGSTAVASTLVERNYLGFEVDKNYHAIAVKRLKELYKSIYV